MCCVVYFAIVKRYFVPPTVHSSPQLISIYFLFQFVALKILGLFCSLLLRDSVCEVWNTAQRKIPFLEA